MVTFRDQQHPTNAGFTHISELTFLVNNPFLSVFRLVAKNPQILKLAFFGWEQKRKLSKKEGIRTDADKEQEK
jgi:hypothetical protein